MSIQKKLFTIIVIVGCVAAITAMWLLWSAYTLRNSAQFVVPALNYLESVAKTSTLISKQRRVASYFMVTHAASAREEFDACSASADLSFKEWKSAINEQKLFGVPGETEDLDSQKSIANRYDEWRKETRAIIERSGMSKPNQSQDQYLPHDDAILAAIDSALEDGIEEVHAAYHNLLLSMGVIPWFVMKSTEQMERAHITIDYFVAVIRTADNLNKQLKETMNYLQSGETDHLEKVSRNGIQVEDALAKWSESINRKIQFDAKDVDDKALLLQSENAYRQVQGLIARIIQHKQAGDKLEAIALVENNLQILLDKQMLPAVSLAQADSKNEINKVSNSLTGTAKTAVSQALVTVIFVTLLITALVIRLMKMLTASITQLKSGIEIIGTGNLDNRLNPQTTDELGTLAASLDAMTERLQQSYNENANLNARLEQQVAQLESANREIESFSFMVSHDLRNPISAIIGYADLMKQEHSDSRDEQSFNYLDKIQKAGLRLSQLIEDLMLLSKVAHTEILRVELDASRIATQVMNDLIQREPGRKVSFVCQPGIVVKGSLQLITILLENILGNAWKYSATKEQGVIEFSQIWKDGEMVCLIRDNGVGFDADNAQKIFEAFERLQPTSLQFEGTGIGLAIVQKIVNCHHGRIWAESTVGEGSVFYFALKETS